MKNKNKTVWSKRLKGNVSKSFQRIGSSINVDKRLYKQDIAASFAHVQMLIKQKIIPSQDGKKILSGLKKIKKLIDRKNFIFHEKYEDIHLNIEKRLFEIIGSSAGYMHTARSRNDQVVTDFKLWIKDATHTILKDLNSLMREIIKKAEKNIETVMPGFTHLKNAQPVSFAHYLFAYYEMLKRDKKRFQNNLNLLNESPLGAAALSGTSYNIDRSFTAKKLGFQKPTDNSIDSVSDRDFVIDFLYASAVCAMHLSRLAEDFIIFNSDAFKLIQFTDNVLTGSSIMPQKKNPDPAELIRGRVGINYGKLNAILTIMKGLPMSYFKDLQDDKALAFDGYDTLKDSLLMANELIVNLKPSKERMLLMANEGYTTATDFADYLVKEKKLTFRESYGIASNLVNYAEKNNKNLDQLTIIELKKFYKNLDRKSIACIIYTSGTSGNPKGVVLSHGGILSNCQGALEVLKLLIDKERIVFLTWLPLSHSYEHTVQFVQILLGAKVFYAESLEKLIANMAIAKPIIMTAVPRFYQNLFNKINLNFKNQKGLKKLLISQTLILGKKKLEGNKLDLKERLVDLICEATVRKKIRNQFGGRLKAFVSGGGALDKSIGEFLNAIGLPTLQGYGLTEASPVVSCNLPNKVKVETVGPAFSTNQVKIAEDGEILIKGENVMLGYWNKKEATDESIKDGWLHTGDIGEIDSDGYLKITDRKKDLIVNLGGDNISPIKIENLLCLSEHIKQSFVYGDKKNYLIAILVVEKDFKDADLIDEYVNNLNKNLAMIERVKKYLIIKDEFTIENRMLTPTLKLKRKEIVNKYLEQIENLY